MTQINVTLPETLQEYVEGCVEHGEFATPSNFVRTLIRRERDQRVAALEAEMLEALSSRGVELTLEEVMGGKMFEILETKFNQKT